MGFFLCLMIVLIFFYSIHEMNLIDKFINNNNAIYSYKPKILIYGNNNLVNSIKDICKDENAKYEVIEDDIEKIINKEYNLLILVSNDDLDNIMICSIGRKLCKIKEIISVCNDSRNMRIYKDFKTSCFEKGNLSSKEFLLNMEEKIRHA